MKIGKISQTKISIIVSAVTFSILVVAFIVILNFTREEKVRYVVPEKINVGLILSGSKDDTGWDQSHYDSICRISDEVGIVLYVRENVIADDSLEDVIKDLAENEKCTVIIGCSPDYCEYEERAAAKYPDRYFLNAFGTASGKNIGSFSVRAYQTRYLSGIIAGKQTSTGHIAYVASSPGSDVIRGINAFALGVRSVAPEAVVTVAFCGSGTDDKSAYDCALSLITSTGADVMTMHTDSLAPMQVAEENGVWSIGYNADTSDRFPNTFLTACEWEWDSYYKEQIMLCKQAKFSGEHTWLGIDSGIMKLTPLEKTNNAVGGCKELLEAAMRKFSDRSFDVFYGPITDNEGVLRVPEGESMSDVQMFEHFDWYVDGVMTV